MWERLFHFLRSRAVPRNAGEFWTALAALLTFWAVYYAARATRSATKTLEVEQTPVLILEDQHDADRLVLRNVGRGIAVAAFITDEEGKFIEGPWTVGPHAAVGVRANRMEFSFFTGNFIYGQDVGGRWVRTFALYRGFKRSDHQQFNNRIDGRVARWRVPRRALRELRRTQYSSLQQATTAEDYANMASRFLEEGQADGLPTKIDGNGVIRVFDPQTGTFGSYNPSGTTRTFYKATQAYFDRQPGAIIR